MKRPSLLNGIAFAFAIAVFAVPVWWGLKNTLPYSWAFRTAAIVPYLVYTSHLLVTAHRRVGNITLSAANLSLAIALFALPTGNSIVLVALVALVSLNRSLLFHRSMLSFAADGFVSGVGIVFAGYLFSSTSNLPAALWGYFLLQSIFVMIPPRFSDSAESFPAGEQDPVDPFQRSRRQAQAALQRLVQHSGS